jgi:hypothetical protein
VAICYRNTSSVCVVLNITVKGESAAGYESIKIDTLNSQSK